MSIDDHSAGEEQADSGTDLSRRGFVKNSGKALYIAPTLTLLGSAPALADPFGSPPPPPGGAAPAPPAPDK